MPNSALSLMRQLNYDPRIGRAPTLCRSHCIRWLKLWTLSHRRLVSNPVPELSLLHEDTLFQADSIQLQPGRLTPLALSDATAGDAIDLNASFVLTKSTTAFGLSVLANPHNLSGSAVVRVRVTTRSDGSFHGVVNGSVEPTPIGTSEQGAVGSRQGAAPRVDLSWSGRFS